VEEDSLVPICSSSCNTISCLVKIETKRLWDGCSPSFKNPCFDSYVVDDDEDMDKAYDPSVEQNINMYDSSGVCS